MQTPIHTEVCCDTLNSMSREIQGTDIQTFQTFVLILREAFARFAPCPVLLRAFGGDCFHCRGGARGDHLPHLRKCGMSSFRRASVVTWKEASTCPSHQARTYFHQATSCIFLATSWGLVRRAMAMPDTRLLGRSCPVTLNSVMLCTPQGRRGCSSKMQVETCFATAREKQRTGQINRAPQTASEADDLGTLQTDKECDDLQLGLEPARFSDQKYDRKVEKRWHNQLSIRFLSRHSR